MSKAAFVGGGQAGYNWQVNAVVLGAEVDFDSFNVRLSRTGSGVLPTIGGTFTITSSANTDWLFTARGRVGWAFDNLLLYGTGGLAETHLNASNSYTDTAGYPPGPGVGAWNASAMKLGWTAGGGLEWALTRNWSVKAEYLFVKFGSINASGTVVSAINPTGYASAIGTSTDLTASIARAGINYKF
jgi:outer membrane immunogenic protein